MRLVFLVAAIAAALGIAAPASAERYVLLKKAPVTLPTCASGGGTSATVSEGQYILSVANADVYVCYSATCATGGALLVAGSQIPIQTAQITASCRSDGGGVVQFIPADVIR